MSRHARCRQLRPSSAPPPATGPTVFNVNAAKTHLSKLLNRVDRGERITIARAGKPVAVIAPAPAQMHPPVSTDDPLRRVEEYAYDGSVEKLTNAAIDRIVYGI